mmetsp:Transcript_22630/g.57318  ORF Transcript_22630/g.57318 Transcript_22630/m.57318 type:complete len:203 (+) Transcript_22630:3234-3842(+)
MPSRSISFSPSSSSISCLIFENAPPVMSILSPRERVVLLEVVFSFLLPLDEELLAEDALPVVVEAAAVASSFTGAPPPRFFFNLLHRSAAWFSNFFSTSLPFLTSAAAAAACFFPPPAAFLLFNSSHCLRVEWAVELELEEAPAPLFELFAPDEVPGSPVIAATPLFRSSRSSSSGDQSSSSAFAISFFCASTGRAEIGNGK